VTQLPDDHPDKLRAYVQTIVLDDELKWRITFGKNPAKLAGYATAGNVRQVELVLRKWGLGLADIELPQRAKA
jgi:hypothetical protein